ncbi:MAG: hypothetical protein AB7I04_06025 [Pseudomonadales bacterium]
MVTFIRRFGRVCSSMVVAAAALMATHSALALASQGVIYIDVAAGTSEARWEIDDVVQATQALQQVNPCSLVTTPGLLSFSSNVGAPSAKQDAVGVDYLNGKGTACAGIDARGSTRESLTVTLGPTLRLPAAAKNLRFIRLVLQLELKGTSSVTEIVVSDEFSDTPAKVWEVRGGAAIDASDPGRDPADAASSNPIIDCLGGGSDVAPDARDTCVVSISAFGNSFTLTTLEGSTSLEGGRSIAGPSEIHLTSASGLYDCGDTLTTTALSQGDVTVASASCRRLEENLVNCPTSTQCVAVPADLRFENAGYDLVLEYEEGDQCVAVQCQVAFAPYDITSALPGGTRTTTAIEVDRINDTYPLTGIETTYLQPPVVQFLESDPEYYVQHCVEELVRHPVVEVDDVFLTAAPGAPFVAGDIVSNQLGVTAKVISYQDVNGLKSLVYYIEDPADSFAAGDEISGPSGSATIQTAPAPSSFIEKLVGDTLNNGGAGYELLDYSPAPGGKTNAQGIQHACLRSLDIELPGFTADGITGSAATNFVRILIDVYLQRDIRLSVSSR